MWYLDGNNTANTTINMWNTSFPVIGTYVVSCQAENLVVKKSNSTIIYVQDLITNLTLHAGNLSNVSTSNPLETARFQLRMLTGSNYICTINFDNRQTSTNTYYFAYGYISGSYIPHQYIDEGAYNVSE
jgi:hypothetical protein